MIVLYLPENPEKYYMNSIATKTTLNNKKSCSFNNWCENQCFFCEK